MVAVDGPSRSFISDLEALRDEYAPRIKEAADVLDGLKHEAMEGVMTSCTLWASQSERPGAIRQAAKVATMRLEDGTSNDFGMASARAVLSAAWDDGASRRDDARRRTAKRESQQQAARCLHKMANRR